MNQPIKLKNKRETKENTNIKVGCLVEAVIASKVGLECVETEIADQKESNNNFAE